MAENKATVSLAHVDEIIAERNSALRRVKELEARIAVLEKVADQASEDIKHGR